MYIQVWGTQRPQLYVIYEQFEDVEKAQPRREALPKTEAPPKVATGEIVDPLRKVPVASTNQEPRTKKPTPPLTPTAEQYRADPHAEVEDAVMQPLSALLKNLPIARKIAEQGVEAVLAQQDEEIIAAARQTYQEALVGTSLDPLFTRPLLSEKVSS
jgi:hypothetical protein